MESVVKDMYDYIGMYQINDLLSSRGWKRYQEEAGEYRYKKDSTTQDEYVVRLTDKNIIVAVPLPNSDFLFATKFTSYFEAAEFIEKHLDFDEERKLNCPTTA